jgi:type I restriction enzyme S subunit
MDRYYEGGTIPWVKSGELREAIITETEEYITEVALKETSVKLVPAGALLLAMYGATVGRLGILGIAATTNQAVCHIVPDPKAAETRYVYHALRAQVTNLIALGVGGAQPNINQGIIKDLVLPLPPLAEQRRIAEVLDRAEALRAKRRAALEQIDTLTQSIFVKSFGDAAEIHKRWPIRSLREVVKDGTIVTYGIVQAGEEYPGGVPYIRTGDIVDGEVTNNDLRHTDPEIAAKFGRSRVQAGDIVMSIRATVGTTARIPTELDGANLTQGTAKISPGATVDATYLLSFLRNSETQRWISLGCRSHFATEFRIVT